MLKGQSEQRIAKSEQPTPKKYSISTRKAVISLSLLTLLALAVALGSDAFSLCVGIGMAGVNRRQIAHISITVLIFHIIMPLLGWYVGGYLGSKVGKAAAIVGSILLLYLGARMVWEAVKPGRDEPHFIITNTWGIILLAVSVSMDALSVGFTLGTQRVSLILAAGVIGLVAGAMTLSGLTLGKYVGGWIGERAQVVGGIILAGIGIKLFF